MKFRILLLVLVLVAMLLCSCKHTHKFSDSYNYDDIYHWRECSCDEKRDYEQHSWNNGAVTLNPTMDSEGERTFTCTVCRAKKTEKIDKLGADHTHVYDIVNYDQDGHWNECMCGDKQQRAAHIWNSGEITTYPTLESEGVKTFSCTVCEYKRSEKVDKLDPDHTHAYDTEKNDEHAHWNECICGSRENLLNHSWNEGEITTPAGEKEAGIKTFTCTDCGRKYTEIIKASNDAGLSFKKAEHYKITGRLEKTPLTVEADILVNPSQSARVGAIFGNYIGVRQDWLLEIHENGVPRFYYHDGSGNVQDYFFDQVDVRTGEWTRIAFTFDFANKVMSFYMDGVLMQSITVSHDIAPDATTFEFVVGGDNRSDNGIYFKGKMKSLTAYSDVRTAEELQASVTKGTNLYADDILVSFLLNENTSGNGITDLTGNGYNIPKEWLDSYESDFDYAYSFAVVGDTQWMSKYAPDKMEGIYDWILENQNDKKIAHVFGLGDITEDWNTANKEQEWIRAYSYISKLDGKISYSLVRGNHDESKYFLKYFANEAYMSQFDGFIAEGDIRCSYMTMTVGQTDYLFLTLDFGISDEMIEWANEVVLAHPNHKVIVTTHGYQAFNQDPIDFDNVPSSGGMGSANDVDTNVGNNYRGYNNGQQVWDKFLSKHPNIFLIMSGHTPFEDVVNLQTKGDHGNVVNQMVIDAQWMDPQKGGVGMVCMLYFSEDGTQMAVEWLSTDTGKHYKEQNQFTLDLTNSLNAPAHDFRDAFDDQSHHKACSCGYTHSAQPHVFDGGVLNDDGYMVYTCACGYQRIASATNDPVALALQELLDRYYNKGVYYQDNSFFNGTKYVLDGVSYDVTNDQLTLKDLILGKFGDLKLDLGWNLYEGVYSSANASTVQGMKLLVGATADISRATVEEDGSTLVIKLYSGDSLVKETNVGLYATTTLVTHAGETLDVLYTKSGNDYMIKVNTPVISGLVAEYDYFILDTRHSELSRTVYYSTIAVWDGSVSTSLKGSGTVDDPFLVESGADLAYIANFINSSPAKSANFMGKYFKLTQSIDLNGKNLNMGSYPGWADRKGFYGFFDGNHCTIRGLNNSGNALFGTIETGWLKNLSVYGNATGSHTIGGIVGYAASGAVLENLTSYVTVSGDNTLGGIVGNAENQASDVINCVNYGSVTGTSYIIGGIAGSGGHNITGCVNYGAVTSTTNDVVGGIAGSTKNTGTITNCYNYGTIKARGKAAGIVGQANKPIKGCINYGNVSGTWALGGVVGFIATDATATIDSCVNFGTISATSTGIGGILGIYYNSATGTGTVTINNCVNNGAVSGTWGVGGIAGDTLGVVSGCVNNGMIKATGEVAGIVGKCYGKVTECTNNGEIVGAQAIIGGIVGHLHVSTYLEVINSTNYQNGTVTGLNHGDIIGKIAE